MADSSEEKVTKSATSVPQKGERLYGSRAVHYSAVRGSGAPEGSLCTAAGQTKQAKQSFALPLTGGCVTVYWQQKGRRCVRVCVCVCGVCVCECVWSVCGVCVCVSVYYTHWCPADIDGHVVCVHNCEITPT